MLLLQAGASLELTTLNCFNCQNFCFALPALLYSFCVLYFSSIHKILLNEAHHHPSAPNNFLAYQHTHTYHAWCKGGSASGCSITTTALFCHTLCMFFFSSCFLRRMLFIINICLPKQKKLLTALDLASLCCGRTDQMENRYLFKG